MEYKTEEESEAYSDTNSDSQVSKSKRHKTSYVWTFFRPIEVNGKEVNECIICNAYVGKQTSNLARHLVTTHSITKPNLKGSDEKAARSRASRSFVWKYSSKEDLNHARCHFCDKVLYCGGGNTSNLSKHLRRRHMDVIDESMSMEIAADAGEEVAQATSSIIVDDLVVEGVEEGEFVEGSEYKVFGGNDLKNEHNISKDRKGSYVWNFCDKLSRHTIRCKLCSKVMNFHGTANVITHLQRRHNIVGPTTSVKSESSFMVNDPKSSDEVGNNLSRRRSVSSSSEVWKYCKRINRDVVRCSFCKKNLSYQGTSNLQRHLHRMHGIITPGRTVKSTAGNVEDQIEFQFTEEFLSDYIENIDDGTQAKCKLCDRVFSGDYFESICKHLVGEHALRPPEDNRNPPVKIRKHDLQNLSDEIEDDNRSNWSNMDNNGGGNNSGSVNESVVKKDDSFFDDIIEEVDEANNVDFNDEEPIDDNVLIENPLSPHSTQSCIGDMSPDPKRKPNAFDGYPNNQKLQKLYEERTLMETEYFKEKASFFRMQKYYVALQAKKIRIELERLNNAAIEYTGPTYTVNVDIPGGEEMAILPIN